MNRTFKLFVVAVLIGGSRATLAASTSASFADTFATMQSLSSNSSQWQPTPSQPTRLALTPRSPLSIADYQALASNSPQWQGDQAAVRVDRGPTFARTHPQGIPFAEYQALAANSDQYAISENDPTSAIATSDAGKRAREAGTRLRNRLTSLFRPSASPPTQDD
jgi:hypothetical protein